MNKKDQALPEQSPRSVSLLGAFQLFKESLTIYKENFSIIGSLTLIFALVSLFFNFLPEIFKNLDPVLRLIFNFLLFILLLIPNSWFQASLLDFLKNKEKINIFEIYRRNINKIIPFLWVNLLVSFVIFGGFLFFLIPGIIYALWFAFSLYVLFNEDIRGVNALLKSREYVRGYWWKILWRFFFFFLIMFVFLIVTALLSMSIPFGYFVSMLVIIFLWTPLIIIYNYLIYSQLKNIKGEFTFQPTTGQKLKIFIIPSLGFLIFVILILAMVFASLFFLRNFLKI